MGKSGEIIRYALATAGLLWAVPETVAAIAPEVAVQVVESFHETVDPRFSLEAEMLERSVILGDLEMNRTQEVGVGLGQIGLSVLLIGQAHNMAVRRRNAAQ